MCGRISDPGMGIYPPRGTLAQSTSPSQSTTGQWGWGFHTFWGSLDSRGVTCFVHRLSELYRCGTISLLGIGHYRPPVALALISSPSQSTIDRWGCGFHTLRGSFDLGDHRFRPQHVWVVKVWKYYLSGDGTLSSPDVAGFALEPQSIKDGSAGLGFPHRAGRYQPEGSSFSSPGRWICIDMEVFTIRG